ncbi:MAG: hypothetical protein KIT31_26060 [Deltaproteobacteria bacterium]|nr:hypothetical protein [Deltaproteobacteria bacterium]
MKLRALVVLLPLAACGPSKSESIQAFLTVTAAASSAQARAVADAQAGPNLVLPAALTLDFSGPCTLGGTVGVAGAYDTSGSGERAAFDLTASFDGCREATGRLDGDLHWASVAEADRFVATMDGAIDYDGSAGNFTCDFDLSISVDSARTTFGGSFCGYDVATDLRVAP